MAEFTSLNSRVIPLPINNVDTDQVIPARFLKVTNKSGLGQNLFADWRYLPDGSPNPDFVLNHPEHQGAAILLAGDNFGCGSSREHAPWALTGWGIRVVISSSFADIFKNNALKNGLLPIVVAPETLEMLFELTQEAPQAEWVVDLRSETLNLPTGHVIHFTIDPFARTCLLQGKDELGYLLSFEEKIKHYEESNN